GLVVDLTAPDLAFTPDETAAVVAAALGAGDTALAAEVHAATAGWPAAVRLTAEALARVPPDRRRDAIQRLRRPGGILHDYLTEEVLAGETGAVRDLLARLSVLELFTPDLAEALVPGGAEPTLAALVRRGLVVDAPGRGQAWLRVNALVREVVAAAPASRE